MTFSLGSESETDKTAPEIVEMMFKDYASFTGIEFVGEDKAKGGMPTLKCCVPEYPRSGSEIREI